MLKEGLGIRFARKGEVIPNMEVKFVKDHLDSWCLKERLQIITKEGDLFIAPLAEQVAYKRFMLKSKKDLEDAQHLQKVFHLSEEKINKFKAFFEKHGCRS